MINLSVFVRHVAIVGDGYRSLKDGATRFRDRDMRAKGSRAVNAHRLERAGGLSR
jgi:hypothetical protein